MSFGLCSQPSYLIGLGLIVFIIIVSLLDNVLISQSLVNMIKFASRFVLKVT